MPGDNALGAILADGWYSGYVGFGKQRDHYGKHTALQRQLHLEYADGSTEIVATGQTGRRPPARSSRPTSSWAKPMTPERQSPAGTRPGSTIPGGRRSITGAEVNPLVQAHPGPPVRAFAEFRPKTITEPKPGVYVLDLGQNFAGVPRLKIHGEPGQKITLRFAERLNPDGTIYTTNLRSARCIDTYICNGKGEETWQPRFTFHGFQYVEITGLKSPPTRGHGHRHRPYQRHARRRPVRVLRPDAQQAPQQRLLDPAGQLHRHPHRLPPARRAAGLDRRRPGLRPHGHAQLRRAGLLHQVAGRPGRRPAARRPVSRWSPR